MFESGDEQSKSEFYCHEGNQNKNNNIRLSPGVLLASLVFLQHPRAVINR